MVTAVNCQLSNFLSVSVKMAQEEENFRLDSDSDEDCLVQYIREHEGEGDEGDAGGDEGDAGDGDVESSDGDEEDRVPLAAAQWVRPPDPLAR